MTHRAPTAVSRSIGEYSKAIVSLLGALITILTQVTPIINFLPEGAQNTIGVALAVLTGVSTYLVSNTPNAQKIIDDARDLGLVVKQPIV